MYAAGLMDNYYWLSISVSILSQFSKSSCRNVGEWEDDILKAKLGYMKGTIMAKRKPTNEPEKQSDKVTERNGVTRWINANLSDDDMAALEGTEYTLESVGSGLLFLASVGWDLTLKRDAKSGGYTAFGFTDDPHSTDGRVGLSGWGSDVTDAAIVLLYKYHNILEKIIPAPNPNQNRRFR